MFGLQRACRIFCFAALVAVMAAAAGLVFTAAPALAQCNGMELMPDGSWEFNPDLCKNAGPVKVAPPKIWAAIAYSQSNLRTAIAWHGASQDAARKTALAACGTVRPDCKIAISGYACVAFAISLNGKWGTGYALDYITADHMAQSVCGDHGGTQCLVMADPCAGDDAVNGKYSRVGG